MKQIETDSSNDFLARASLDRRRFLTRAGVLGLGAAAAGVMFAGAPSAGAQTQASEQDKDTNTEILTAFLIAEDLATTFYYNGLIGQVIMDPALAGPGGTAKNVSPGGNVGNVNYLQAALTEEILHADLFRAGLGISNPSGDPVQTFYFPAGTFQTLAAFTGVLNTLEDAFIGAYLTLIQEAALKAGRNKALGQGIDKKDYEYLAKVAASILGVECEHRVLGRVISNTNPANNLAYEQTAGLTAVYNGPNSAVAALTPFLTSSTGQGYTLSTALAGQAAVSLPVTGDPPTM